MEEEKEVEEGEEEMEEKEEEMEEEEEEEDVVAPIIFGLPLAATWTLPGQKFSVTEFKCTKSPDAGHAELLLPMITVYDAPIAKISRFSAFP
uniref:Uncharacterized protein n=1 Tax=Vespula pensylvanica TaxID=30213 RepID=A0A834P7Z0_VESPE|nr:hypothetical protein H0235_004678 [Vespula pensylvanica]